MTASVHVRLDDDLAAAIAEQVAVIQQSQPRASRSTVVRMLLRTALQTPEALSESNEMVMLVYANVSRFQNVLVRRIQQELPALLEESLSD